MSALGGDAGFYGNLPESYNLVVNTNHPLVVRIAQDLDKKAGERLEKLDTRMEPLKESREDLQKNHKDKKEEEIPQEEKDRIEDLDKKINELMEKRREILTKYGQKNKKVNQLVDLALLANNMLRGEKLNVFVKRSIDLL